MLHDTSTSPSKENCSIAVWPSERIQRYSLLPLDIRREGTIAKAYKSRWNRLLALSLALSPLDDTRSSSRKTQDAGQPRRKPPRRLQNEIRRQRSLQPSIHDEATKSRSRRFICAAYEQSHPSRNTLSRAPFEYLINTNSSIILPAFWLLISRKINLSGCETPSGRELK